MVQKDASNVLFQLAVDLVNDTSQHIFLTGKAGTGKTTFLRYIKEHTSRNCVIVAPTGVAAINAGGVTLHSFFQLPRGMFVPGTLKRDDLIGFVDINDKHSLFRNIHFTSNKRQLLQELELLIIDEVSMMRCDMLDAVDAILRHFRKAPHLPFGGVQVVYIGDLFQLPPVVSNEEWNVLQQHYYSPFFFSAKAVAEAPPLYIELKKIYRQNEQEFIEVLNRIRNNQPSEEDFAFLNRKYNPAFESPSDAHYITVTTHNKKAETINAAELAKLPGPLYRFTATIRDDFSDKALPTDLELQLKTGAQVMFIKNDSSTEKRYFNGKIATVKKIAGDEITVEFADSGEDFVLEKETWENIRYIYNRENDDIDEEVLGSFTQFPIRLAWAITVHKSQGLTFDRAIIDAGASFAPGQVYVALSRCVSTEGLVLKSKIHPFAVSTDKRIIAFAQREVDDPSALEQILEKEKYRHWALQLVKIFDWSKLVEAFYQWLQVIPQKKLPDVPAAQQLAQSLMIRAKEQMEVAGKFQRQLEQILREVQQTKETSVLEQRMQKAISFFGTALTEELLAPLQEHNSNLQYTTRLNKYKEDLLQLEGMIWGQVQKLIQAKYGSVIFIKDNPYRRFDPVLQKSSARSSVKKEKVPSQKITLDLFREGKSIEEIAQLRNITPGTVEGHLAPFVLTGEIEAETLVRREKIVQILQVIEVVGTASMGLIKTRLGDDFSFHEIRVGVNHYRNQKKQTA